MKGSLEAFGIVIATFILLVSCQKKTSSEDEDKPYEFGFVIDGQQHRHEKKDVRGIVEGEFGFITADGIYHVTVYATDENGDFHILSMRNVRISAPLDGSPLPPGARIEGSAGPNPAKISTQAPVRIQTSTSTAKYNSYPFTTQPTIKPACAGCGYVTTSVKPPVVQNTNVQNPSGNPNNIYSTNGNQNQNFNPNGNPGPSTGLSNSPFPNPDNKQIYNTNFNANGSPNPNAGPSSGLSNSPFPNPDKQNPNFNANGLPNSNPGLNSPFSNPNANNLYNLNLNKNPNGNPNSNENPGSNPSPGINPGLNNYPVAPNPNLELPVGNPYQNQNNPRPPTGPIDDRLQSGPVQNNPSPFSNVQVQNGAIHIPGNPDIPIKDKYPGMVDGLPHGITEKDIGDLLYKFNYTVGFHGHYERGTRNGGKIGGYFVNGRDGISRIVTYVADEYGYRPKVKFIRLDLNSDDVPKEATEKSFGLKNFEFIWYPIS